jgi:hypothetical protein
MSLFYTKSLRQKARSKVTALKSLNSIILHESSSQESEFSEGKTFSIFISHSYLDKELVLGLKLELESLGYSTYVDWIEDNQLDRNSVNKKTAETLRRRMKQCKSLFFATTDNSTNSKWMPWECGYFDALKDRVAICPISNVPSQIAILDKNILGYILISIKTQ